MGTPKTAVSSLVTVSNCDSLSVSSIPISRSICRRSVSLCGFGAGMKPGWPGTTARCDGCCCSGTTGLSIASVDTTEPTSITGTTTSCTQ